MSKEMTFEEIEYNGYYGKLSVELEPIVEDCSFDAFNGAGVLQLYGGNSITGFEVLQAYFTIIHDNGNEGPDLMLESKEAHKLIESMEDSIIEQFDVEEL